MADALAVMRKSITLLDEVAAGRYRELGVDEFHLSWPRAKDGIGISREREAILERIAGRGHPQNARLESAPRVLQWPIVTTSLVAGRIAKTRGSGGGRLFDSGSELRLRFEVRFRPS